MTPRTIAERATRRVRIVRRLPADFGRAPIWTTPASGLRYLLRRMSRVDPELLGLARELVSDGDVVWDVGANLGLFSVAAAVRAGPAGQVVAIEPDDDTMPLLRRTSRMQSGRSAPIVPLAAAIGRRVELRTFCIARRTRSTNFLEGYGSTQTGGVAEARSVVAVTLDWLAERLPPPRVVKIDVEGAELEVLEGGAQLLRTARPSLICEVSARAAHDVHARLTALDYDLFDAATPPSQRAAADSAPFSTIALPR